MQVKKINVKNKILDNAILEFLDKGYEKASLRKIVKMANTTTGNFYNYFSSKEELFSNLVNDIYKSFIDIIENHSNSKKSSSMDLMDINILKSEITNFISMFTDILNFRFVLLLECSTGTKYENARHEFKTLLSNHFYEHLKKNNTEDIYEGFGEILSEQFINGLINIIKKSNSKEEIKNLLTNQLLFFSFGVMGITKFSFNTKGEL